MESRRSISCSAGISREKNATPLPFLSRFCTILSAKEVFPIAGRAAMMTRSPLPKPVVILFRSAKPVSTPTRTELPRAFISSM